MNSNRFVQKGILHLSGGVWKVRNANAVVVTHDASAALDKVNIK